MAKKCTSCNGNIEGLFKKICSSCETKASNERAAEFMDRKKNDYSVSLSGARSTRPDLADAWERMGKLEDAKWQPDLAKNEAAFRVLHPDVAPLIPENETVVAAGCGVTSVSGCTWIVTDKSLVIHEYSIWNNSTKASEVAKLDMITGIQTKLFAAHTGSKTITVTRAANTDHLSVVHKDVAEELVKALNKGISVSDKQSNALPSNQTASKLRELKGLLDEGIITQEEFDKKKSDFLGKM